LNGRGIVVDAIAAPRFDATSQPPLLCRYVAAPFIVYDVVIHAQRCVIDEMTRA